MRRYWQILIGTLGVILMLFGGYLLQSYPYLYREYLETEIKVERIITLYQMLEKQLNIVTDTLGGSDPLPLIEPYQRTPPTRIILIGSTGMALYLMGAILVAVALNIPSLIVNSRWWRWLEDRWYEDYGLAYFIQRNGGDKEKDSL